MDDESQDPWGDSPETGLAQTAPDGLVYDLANGEYHAHPSISKSGLDRIDLSPAHFIKSERKETQAFMKGTLIHCAILEPDFVDGRYFAMPEKVDARTKAGKALLAEYTAMADGKVLVSGDDMRMAVRIREEVQNHPTARVLFDGGISEASAFSRLNGADVRCRPDYLNGSVVIDLKSTECATPASFRRSVEKYRYFVQHPFYVDVLESKGVEISNFIFVAIEKSEPYGIGIFELDDEAIQCGRRAYLANLDTYKRCLDSGHWPCYPDRITSISLSRHARDAVDRRIDESY